MAQARPRLIFLRRCGLRNTAQAGCASMRKVRYPRAPKAGPAWRRLIMAAQALAGRPAKPQEIAEAIVFLATIARALSKVQSSPSTAAEPPFDRTGKRVSARPTSRGQNVDTPMSRFDDTTNAELDIYSSRFRRVSDRSGTKSLGELTVDIRGAAIERCYHPAGSAYASCQSQQKSCSGRICGDAIAMSSHRLSHAGL